MSATVHDQPGSAVQGSGLLGWGTVRAGLGVSFFGTLLAILSPMLLFVVNWTMEGQEKPTVLQLVALGSCLLGWLAGGVLFIAGVCMGAAAPAESGVRGWSIGACLLGPLSVVMLVLLGLIGSSELIRLGLNKAREMREDSPFKPDLPVKDDLPAASAPVFTADEAKAIVLTFEGVCLLTLLCHLLALRRVASSFQRLGLSIGVACFMLCSILWVAGLNTIGLKEERLTASTLENLGLLFLVGVAVLQVWYLALAAMVRRAISEGLLGR